MTIHILNQYLWPDCAPTAIYADQLGTFLKRNGYRVRRVGGNGEYRLGNRPQPDLEEVVLPVWKGTRGRVLSTIKEYHSIYGALDRYIRSEVCSHDVVIVTSAPPQSISLIDSIRDRGGIGIYWLQDYYPELLRGFVEYPSLARRILSGYWNRTLESWNRVVKISGNLAYHGENATIIRNGTTLDLGPIQPFEPGLACYFGNLGYGHSLEIFVESCRELREKGYKIIVLGDGPKASQLPPWIERKKILSERELIAWHWKAEVHLVAADPNITGAVFPSKYWNSRLTGRRIVPSGFAGSMLEEWRYVEGLTEMPSLQEWISLLKTM